jgi:hypothetical protein
VPFREKALADQTQKAFDAVQQQPDDQQEEQK